MKTHLLSDGKKFHFLYWAHWGLVLGFGLTVISCASRSQRSEKNEASMAEVSLKSDRSHLDQIRNEIPEPVQQKNDELAYILSLMKEGKTPPQKVRSQFYQQTRKTRDRFREMQRKKRDQFNKEERKSRKIFLDGLKKEKDHFKGRETTREQRKEKYDDWDARRKEYFDSERTKRKEFESESREESKSFDAEMRDKQKQFDLELREYTKVYNERKTLERKQKQIQHRSNRSQRKSGVHPPNGASRQNPQLSEFEELNQQPGQTLSTPDGE